MATNPVQWQVDLPGLSSLILNMGAAGLKKFAEAGVDIHTLLCMGEIAEVCPASLEYRKEINACRKQQRNQSIWLYKLVEVGTASNFLADELLKKRTGENIVALMSTILPILVEDDCDSFMLRLFETRKIDPDKTPGLTQVQAFRDAILPLVQKLAFKDRTCQYHMLLRHLHDGVPPRLCTSVPDIETLVQVMLMLQRLVIEQNSTYVLTYRGWKGAAWVITYARHVLGLAVCVLRTQHDTIPINGQYHNSKVFIYLFDEASRCELVASGHISDLVILTDAIRRTQWAIDLENVSLRSLYLPDDPTSAEAASVITRSLALQFTAQHACSLARIDTVAGVPLQSKRRLSSYTMYCLPQLHRRALDVIDVMGFRTGAGVEPDANTWKDFFRLEEGPDVASFLMKPGPKWVNCALPCLKDRIDHSFDWEGERLLNRMIMLADAASCLAFSNWGRGLKTLSTIFLENGLPANYASLRLLKETDSSGSTSIRVFPRLGAIYRIYSLMRAVTFVVMGRAVDTMEVTMAFERQGVVVARAAAAQKSINLDTIFIHFYAGHLMMLGQRRPEIRNCSDASGQECDCEIWNPPTHDARAVEIHPLNGFPEMTIKSLSALTRTSIEVTQNLVLGDRIYQLRGPTFSNDKILDSYVTDSCSHAYSTPASISLQAHEVIRNGLHLGLRHQSNSMDLLLSVYVQSVDQNPYGQWASMHCANQGQTRSMEKPHVVPVNILQRGMCIKCTVDVIRDQPSQSGPSGLQRKWYIVAGGMAEHTENAPE